MPCCSKCGDAGHYRKTCKKNNKNTIAKLIAEDDEAMRQRANRFHTEMCKKYKKGTLEQWIINKCNKVKGWTWDIKQLL